MSACTGVLGVILFLSVGGVIKVHSEISAVYRVHPSISSAFLQNRLALATYLSFENSSLAQRVFLPKLLLTCPPHYIDFYHN